MTITVSHGRFATVNGRPTPYMYGSGYGHDETLRELGHKAAEYLASRYKVDLEIRGNSDGHSCGAHYDGLYKFSLGAWRAHKERLNSETFEKEPNPDAGKVTFGAYFSVPVHLESMMQERFPQCWIYPDAKARERNPSEAVTVYSEHFDTMDEAAEWLEVNGEAYSPVLFR